MNAAMQAYGAKTSARNSYFNAQKLGELNQEKQNQKNQMEEQTMANNTKNAIINPIAGPVVSYETDSGATVQLTASIVRSYLVNGGAPVSDQEIYMFMQLCQYQKINPFLREAYLVKYSEKKPASMVCGKELFTKRAERHLDFDGHEAGVMILTKDNKIQNRPGTTYLPKFGETLLGGWAKVHRKSYKIPIEATVMLDEYRGAPNSLWDTKPATMIRKVALVQALREAFPDMYGGLYSQEEINTINDKDLPEEPVKPKNAEAESDPNKTIDEETQHYLCECMNRDVEFAKKILAEFGYKRVLEIKQCDFEAIVARIEEVREEMAKSAPEAGEAPEAEAEPDMPEIISEAQRRALFAKA
ncbi:MAG: phage recombination protein Bet, partial [Oscillospiraceae bacterium]|nr:phage recombination protein Bet [Oscillospiraceae bacterium]